MRLVERAQIQGRHHHRDRLENVARDARPESKVDARVEKRTPSSPSFPRVLVKLKGHPPPILMTPA